MNLISLFFVLQCFLFFGRSAAINDQNETIEDQSQNRKNTDFLDLIREDLAKGGWSDNEACHNQTLAFLERAQNSTLAGMWLWDAMQLPTGALYGSRYQLGNYDECLRAPWPARPALRTQYCLADVQLASARPHTGEEFGPDSPAARYISTRTEHARDLTKLTWGVCLPSTCDPGSVANFTRILLDKSPLGRAVVDPRVAVDSCRISGEKKPFFTGLHVFLIVVIVLIMIAITATIVVKNSTSKTFAIEVAEAFCLRNNWKGLFKQSKDDIKILNPLKVIMATWAVMGHNMLMKNSMAIQNAMDMEKDLVFGFSIHFDVGISGFFTISGLLFARNLLNRDQNILLVLIKRYFRLIGPFALMVLFFGTAWTDAGDGPLWLREAGREQRYCQHNWWLSLLMLNNYVHTDRLCHFVSWSNPADFHLTLVCAALYLVYRRSPRLAKILFTVLASFALAVPVVTSHYYQLKGMLASDVDSLIHYSSSTYFVKFYSKSHTHASAYFTGVVGAYILTVYKPKTNDCKSPNKILDAFLFLLFSTSLFSLFFMGYLFWNRTFEDNTLAATIFEGTNRVYFAIIFCYAVLCYHYGTVTVGRQFFFWPVWVPLSKLTYGLYLIHPAILLRTIYSTRSPGTFDMCTVFIDGFGAVTVGFMLSLLMYLLVEMPLCNLSNLILNQRKKEVSSNTLKAD